MLLGMLVDVATLFKLEADPDDPWGEATLVPHVLSSVRISEGSGSRTVDAQGISGARQATLFFFKDASLYDGNYEVPTIAKGEKLCRGTATTTPADAWTVSGIVTVKNGVDVHHLEVSLV